MKLLLKIQTSELPIGLMWVHVQFQIKTQGHELYFSLHYRFDEIWTLQRIMGLGTSLFRVCFRWKIHPKTITCTVAIENRYTKDLRFSVDLWCVCWGGGLLGRHAGYVSQVSPKLTRLLCLRPFLVLRRQEDAVMLFITPFCFINTHNLLLITPS